MSPPRASGCYSAQVASQRCPILCSKVNTYYISDMGCYMNRKMIFKWTNEKYKMSMLSVLIRKVYIRFGNALDKREPKFVVAFYRFSECVIFVL